MAMADDFVRFLSANGKVGPVIVFCVRTHEALNGLTDDHLMALSYTLTSHQADWTLLKAATTASGRKKELLEKIFTAAGI
jgi:hypothetical protein